MQSTPMQSIPTAVASAGCKPRMWRSGTRYLAREVALFWLRGALIRKQRQRIDAVLELLSISRHAYYNAREYLQAHGIMRTRKTGRYRATRAHLEELDTTRLLQHFFGGDAKAFARAVGLPVQRLAAAYPELYAAIHEPELLNAYEQFRALYPRRASTPPWAILLPDFVRACKRYGIDAVLEATRIYRNQQDALAKATGGRSGTGTRFVLTVERFLQSIHEIKEPKPKRVREAADAASVQYLVELLMRLGMDAHAARRFVESLEPTLVREYASDPYHRRYLSSLPDLDAVQRYLQSRSDLRRNQGQLVPASKIAPAPAPPAAQAAPVQLSQDTIDACVAALQQHGIIAPDEADATRALLERNPIRATMIADTLQRGNIAFARRMLSALRC